MKDRDGSRATVSCLRTHIHVFILVFDTYWKRRSLYFQEHLFACVCDSSPIGACLCELKKRQ